MPGKRSFENEGIRSAVRDKILGESVTVQNLDKGSPKKRVKAEDRISKAVQGETKCGEKHWELRSIDLDKCASLGKHNQDNSSAKFASCDCKAKKVDQELINLSIIQHDHPHRFKVRNVLKLFEEQYTELLKERKTKGEGKGTNHPHLEVAQRLKGDGMWIYFEKPFGHIPGVEIGDVFRFRSQLAIVGVHQQLHSGIDYWELGGKKFATSIVNAGLYENEAKALDILIYSGQGGNPKIVDKAADQKLEKGNLALMNSMKMGYPVRVTYKRKSLAASNTLGMSKQGYLAYIYDGLYSINKSWQQRDQNGKLVFKFELHRISGQPRPHQTNAKSRKQIMQMEVCMVDDMSQGKETRPIRAINGVDDDRPSSFNYITNIMYPSSYQRIEPVGCNCIDGCSDTQQCPCILKNGGEIPFNEKGAIIKPRLIVHECGPSCKCPPSCMNRVSQLGPQYQLEVFKTMTKGWGVRSKNYISSGSFICEYVGELLNDKEAEQRIGNDEYPFDSSDGRGEGAHGEFNGFLYLKSNDNRFVIDAARFGNIGRFINRSCSPNLYAQKVLYDHHDERIPHIMFFATKSIPPLKELSYDYN